MGSGIFELDFGRTDVFFLSIIPAIISFAIFIYVSLFLQRTRVTGYFSIFVLMLMLWQLSEGVVKLCVTEVAAAFWYSIVQKVLSLVIIFGLFFSVFFTKLDKKIPWNILFSIVVFPAMFFAFCVDGNIVQSTQVKSEYWYWIFNPDANLISVLFLSWISLGGLLMLSMFWLNLNRKWKTVAEQKQAILLAFGFTIPIVIGITIEVIFPIVFKINDIPITSTLTTVFSVLAFIAIKKYHMLQYSPKHHWENIVDSMNEGILIVDNKDEIKYANEAFCKLMEFQFIDIEGKGATELFSAQKFNLEKSKSKIVEQSKIKSDQYEVLLQTRTGKQKWFLVGVSPYIDSYGNLVGSIGIHADITERKRAEEELMVSNIELEIFVYKASHDLRGPLASIIGLVNVSKYEITDELGIKYLGMIESATQKLDTTLRELVKTMKIKDTMLFTELIDFEEIITIKLNEFKYYNNFSRLKVTTNVSISNVFYSNRFIIETIIQNLIENSVKYQNINEPESYLKINVSDHRDGIQIIVSDNGIGIEQSVQNKIFDMYFKGTESSKGSGLGLYLVKKCVEKLEGEIILDSKKGKGTRFTVLLKARKVS